MRKNLRDNVSFVSVVVAVIVMLWAISGRGSPSMPRDALHAQAQLKSDCSACHREGQEAAPRSTHPQGVDDCIVCHRGKSCHP